MSPPQPTLALLGLVLACGDPGSAGSSAGAGDSAVLWYWDVDGDAYGSLDSPAFSGPRDCLVSAGSFNCAPRGGDCDDLDASIHPGAREVCNGVDDDCDGLVDRGEDAELGTWYADSDQDGFGDPDVALRGCEPPTGSASQATDCDDDNVAINPAADERCNGLDDDCDGLTDEYDAVDAPTWYLDSDGDGWGDEDVSWPSCEDLSGYALQAGDCDDLDAAVHPGAEEVWYDGQDQDCDGGSDFDADLDGEDAQDWGGVDCDDQDATVNTQAQETCNQVDDDCDGEVDDQATGTIQWWIDADSDGWGDLGDANQACEAPSDGVLVSGDCDDQDQDVHPGAVDDQGDGTDDDCDGTLDNDLRLSEATLVLTGQDESDEAGTALALADLDGDGLADLVVGAAGRDGDEAGAGAVYLLQGSSLDAESGLSEAHASFLGSTASGALGSSVAGPGDLDGDGWVDLALGAPGDGLSQDAQGAVYLAYGPHSGTSTLDAAQDSVLLGEAAGDRAHRLASPGDVNGDGQADLLVGAPGESTVGSDAGAVYVLAGPISASASLADADAKLMGCATGDGAAIPAVAGDVDGDGLDDVLVGAWGRDDAGTAAGAAYLCYGPIWSTAELSVADATLLGESPLDMAGWAVAGAGDADGDGLDDFMVGALGHDGGGVDAGAAYLFLSQVYGSASLADADAKLSGSTVGEGAGNALASAGDLDDDGRSELLVGASSSDLVATGAGVAALFFAPVTGELSLLEADSLLVCYTDEAGAGGALSGALDASGDGYEDLLVGASGANSAFLITSVVP